MKKLISLSLVLVMAFGLFSITALAVNASPTSSTVLVNGKNVAFDAYNIGGNNYFKLRDLASTLNGTPKQFEVGYDDATRAITLTSGKPYTRVGGEMEGKGSGNKEASPTSSRIYMDGKEVQFTAYNIGGNNYFKLRDIGEAFDFGVEWDQAAQTIRIDTSKRYTPEDVTTPPSTSNDAVSMNALVGSWYNSGWDSTVAWSFSADGNFAYSRAYRSGQRTYFSDLKGKFRVNGYTLEFFDCQSDLHSVVGVRLITSENASNLLSSALDNPSSFDDFSGQFEFYDAMELRIKYNISTLDYDHYIQYNDSSHNVTVPTHRIPSLPWPKDLLPADIPEYSNGRIREVTVDHRDGAIRINVDSTTPDSFGEYCNRLLQEGWSFKYSDVSIESVKKGYLVSLQKGKENLMLDGPEEDWDKNTAHIDYWVTK